VSELSFSLTLAAIVEIMFCAFCFELSHIAQCKQYFCSFILTHRYWTVQSCTLECFVNLMVYLLLFTVNAVLTYYTDGSHILVISVEKSQTMFFVWCHVVMLIRERKSLKKVWP
jgi:hypothetical protein